MRCLFGLAWVLLAGRFERLFDKDGVSFVWRPVERLIGRFRRVPSHAVALISQQNLSHEALTLGVWRQLHLEAD